MFKNTRFLSKTTFDLSFSNLFRRPKWPNAREFNDTDTWQYFANETQLPCAPIWPPKDPHANNNVNVHHHHHRSHQASTTAPWCAPTYDNPPHTLWTTLSDVLSAKGGMRNILNNMFEPTALAKNTKQKCCQKQWSGTWDTSRIGRQISRRVCCGVAILNTCRDGGNSCSWLK